MKTRITNGMTLVHTSENVTRVYAAKTVDEGNLTNGFKIIVVDKKFNCSDAKIFGRNEDITNQTAFLSNVADLTAEDAGKVAQYITDNADKISTITLGEKMNSREVFAILYNRLQSTTCVDGYYIIGTNDFNEIIEGCGWKSLHFKKILLSADMLKPNAGRIYDYNVKDENGNSKRYLRINAEALEEEANLSSTGKEVM